MNRIYVGRRGAHGKRVQVVDGRGAIPLADRGPARGAGFGWGGQAAGSVTLARSILWDVAGADHSDGLVITFAGDIIARLPDDAFALDEHSVRRWLSAQDDGRMSPAELVEHLGAVALAAPDEEAETLSGLVDRCWTARGLAN